MLPRLVIAVLIVIAIFLVVAAKRPSAFSVSRSTTIAAPPAVAYAQVDDFHAWPAWSPWAKLDPAMKTTFTGEPGRVGSSYSWTGNNKVGEGRMTLVEVQPPSTLSLKLEFLRPFAATHQCVFTFAPASAGAGTAVTWAMTGNNNFMAKVFSLFVNMDSLLGGDFERGLDQLKLVSEAAARKQEAASQAGQKQ